MSSTGIFWIREDFRIENNPALSFATQNHDNVIALYIYNNNDFDNKREAQKWWVCKSLETLKKELSDYKINLEIVKGDELEIFSKFNKKDKLSVYWNKIYEPDVIARGKKIRDYTEAEWAEIQQAKLQENLDEEMRQINLKNVDEAAFQKYDKIHKLMLTNVYQ